MIHRYDIPPPDRKIAVNESSSSSWPQDTRHTMAFLAKGEGIVIESDSGRRVER